MSEQGPEDRVAVVTSAAAGIGQVLAGRLAADGLRIAIADLEPAGETLAAVEAAGGEGFARRCDVSDGADVESFAAAVRERFGRRDVLVANAGVYPIARFEDWTWEQWRTVMSVNVDSLFHFTSAFLPEMREAGWGRIVRSLAGEVGADGVTINAYAPSLTRTQVPEDIAGLVSFLASDAAGFITGQTVPVDGGAVHA